MKKTLITLITVSVFIFAVLASLNIANGEAEVQNRNKEKMVHYYSSDELLLSFTRPKVEEIVQKEYGQRMPWHFVKVSEVKGIALVKEAKDWFEVKAVIAVEDNSKTKFDALTIKFDDHHYNNDKNSMNNLRDISFDLLEYKKDVKNIDQKSMEGK